MPASQKAIINRILSTAAEYRASDLHFTVGSVPILRVDGKLVPLSDEPVITPEFIDEMVITFITEEQMKKLESERELLGTYTSETKVRFRVHIFYQRHSRAISLRIISNTIPKVEDLGLPRVVAEFANLNKGLVIISGPFGSGRSATVAALINSINQTRAKHIITIEKPIEYLYINNKSIIEQREVGSDALTFEQALDASLKEDVDVLMVSEIEKPEIILAVLEAAAASRLVFASMSTPTVFKTVEQLVNQFPDNQQGPIKVKLAEALEGVVAQRLLPRVGGGRILVTEVMSLTSPIRAIIREGQLHQINNILQTSRDEGMVSLDRALANLVKTGEVIIDDALAIASDRDTFKMMIRS
ncbi:type IV pilus twitching motility protein PilT [Patescibacteria group bacterium]